MTPEIQPRADDDRWVAIATIARDFGVSRWAVQRWIQTKRLPAIKTPSGRWRVLQSEVDRLFTTP
jgi:excisionase family DNA binding protein